jgi:hypothetical protein
VAAVVPGILAFALCAYQLALPGVLMGVHGTTNGRGYDDGIYFGFALRLVHGALPYRDFPFVHPPGIGLLMAPIAALGDILGARDGFAISRVLTALVAGANASLAAHVVRHRGPVTMLLAGTALAVFPLAVSADSTLLLEPYLVLFCLIGLSLMFADGQIASRRRLFFAGLALGFAVCIKVWAIVIVAAALIIVLRRWRTALGPLSLGAVLGFGVPALPFFLAAPHAFMHDVVAAQFSRVAAAPGDYYQYSDPYRISEMLGLPGLIVMHPSSMVAVLIGVTFFAGALLVYAMSWRSMAAADWAVLLMAAAAVAVMFFSAEYYDHYSYFTAPFLAMLFAICASQAWRLIRVYVGYRHTKVFAVSAVVAIVGVAIFMLPQEASYAETYLGASHDFPPAAASLVSPGSCVVSDLPAYGITANRFTASNPDCPLPLDAFYLWLSGVGTNPLSVAHPAVTFSHWLDQANYVMVIAPYGDLVPSAPRLESWFASNFTLVYSSSGLVLYHHTGTEQPPSATTVVTSRQVVARANQLINDGLAAERLGQSSRAFADYQAAAKENPNNVYAPFDLGTIYQQRGDDMAAAAEYQRALSIDPSFANALYNLGVLEATSDPSKAISYYEMDLRLQPDNAPGNFNLGVLLIKQGQASQGYAYLDKALRLEPSLRSDIPPGIQPPPASSGS